MFRDSYVLCIYVMNILCTFHIATLHNHHRNYFTFIAIAHCYYLFFLLSFSLFVSCSFLLGRRITQTHFNVLMTTFTFIYDLLYVRWEPNGHFDNCSDQVLLSDWSHILLLSFLVSLDNMTFSLNESQTLKWLWSSPVNYTRWPNGIHNYFKLSTLHAKWISS